MLQQNKIAISDHGQSGGFHMNPIKLLWSFYGRIGRRAYAGGLLLNLALAAAAIAAVIYLGKDQPRAQPGGPLDPLVAYIILPGFLLFSWAKLALAAKRLHDLGKSGWICLVLFIPFLGLIAVIFLLFARGDDYDNAYGPARRVAVSLEPARS
jgi:uncharacterized membrane protein YhaH (DUF805 family)